MLSAFSHKHQRNRSMEIEGRITAQKNVSESDESTHYGQDKHLEAAVLDKWENVLTKGTPERVYRTLDLFGMTMYICANNIGALVLHTKTCYSFINVRNGCTLAKNRPFISINGVDFSFPFSARVIEYWESASNDYVGIFEILR